MIRLYNDRDLKIIEKKKKMTLLFAILSFVLFAIGLTVFLILSSYKTRMLFSIIASIYGTITVLIGLFFIFKFSFYC